MARQPNFRIDNIAEFLRVRRAALDAGLPLPPLVPPASTGRDAWQDVSAVSGRPAVHPPSIPPGPGRTSLPNSCPFNVSNPPTGPQGRAPAANPNFVHGTLSTQALRPAGPLACGASHSQFAQSKVVSSGPGRGQESRSSPVSQSQVGVSSSIIGFGKVRQGQVGVGSRQGVIVGFGRERQGHAGRFR